MTRVRRLREQDLPADPLVRAHCVAEIASRVVDEELARLDECLDRAVGHYEAIDRWTTLAEQALAATLAIERARTLLADDAARHEGLEDG